MREATLRIRSVILLEKEKAKDTWRIVARQTTFNGFSKWAFAQLGTGYPSIRGAQDDARWIKRKRRRQTQKKSELR